MDADTQPEIDALTAAFYAAFDNRGSRAPAIAELRGLFAAGATVTRVTAERVDAWDPDAFIAPRAAMLTDGTLTEFHEWEVEAQTRIFDNIASRCSFYRKTGSLNGEAYDGGGRKFIQFCRAEGRWRISSVLWEDV